MPVEKVHLHEVGALDSIIDIVGSRVRPRRLGADRVVVSPINVGRGMVQSAHGVFPVPAPATVRLLADAPVFSRGPEAELLTPTGALLLTGYAEAFGPIPAMRVAATGYGAGDHEFADTPNVLRVLVGESADGRVARRSRARRRKRDRRHEPAAVRLGDGPAVRGRRPRGVLRARCR